MTKLVAFQSLRQFLTKTFLNHWMTKQATTMNRLWQLYKSQSIQGPTVFLRREVTSNLSYHKITILTMNFNHLFPKELRKEIPVKKTYIMVASLSTKKSPTALRFQKLFSTKVVSRLIQWQVTPLWWRPRTRFFLTRRRSNLKKMVMACRLNKLHSLSNNHIK